MTLLPIAGVAIKSARPLLGSFLRLFLLSRVGLAFAIYFFTTAAAIYGMSLLGLWTKSLTGSSVLWFLSVGVVWFFNLTEAGKEPNFFKQRLIATLGVSAALEVFVGLVVLPLWAEFAVQGLLGLVVLVNSVAMVDSALRSAARLTAWILTLAGISLFLYTLIEFARAWRTQNWFDVLNQFLLPVWLTAAGIPVLFLIALGMGYGSLFKHLSFWNDWRRPRLRALMGIVVELRGALTHISQFRGPSVSTAARAVTLKAARQAVAEWKESRADDASRRAEARRRLEENAGVAGKDDQGLQLDRREFDSTKSALRWLATCHMGWYRREGERDAYRMDLLTILGDFAQRGLPEPHGIVTKVRKDGQAWYAHRTTASGFVFGIGANGPPPSLWYWQGHRPPPGFPSKRSGWSPDLEPPNPEWKEEDPV